MASAEFSRAERAPNAKSRDASIDWMRVLSLLYIVGFWHLHNYTGFVPWYRAAPLARFTVTMLALFVLISGFLVGRSGKPITRAALGEYYRRRVVRVYPPYLAALAIFTVLGLSGAPFLPSALMINMVVPPPPYTLWFMTMIVLFYLAAPFQLALAPRPGKLIAIVSAVWLVLFFLGRSTIRIEDRLLVYLPAFTAGVLLAAHPLRHRAAVLVGAMLLSVAGYVLSLRAPSADPDQSLWMALWATPSALFAFVALQGRLPRSRIIERLSFGGFFLYLFHRPIYVAVLRLSDVQTAAGRECLLLGVGLPMAVAFGIVAQSVYDSLIDRLLIKEPRPLGLVSS